MVNNFIILDSLRTISDTYNELANSGATFIVVVDKSNKPLKLITSETLAGYSNQDISLYNVSEIPVIIISAGILLNKETVEYCSKILNENLNIAGIIVEDKGLIIGVLPWQVISKHAERILDEEAHRGDGIELSGIPQIPAAKFECPKKDYHEIVDYYDPMNPPTCPIHKLILVQKE